MANLYRNETDYKYEQKIEKLLINYPAFLSDFVTYIEPTTEASTRHGYVKDVEVFFRYLVTVKGDPGIDSVEDITLEYLESLPPAYYMEYMSYLKHHMGNNGVISCDKTTIHRRMVSLRKFFRTMHNAGLIDKMEIDKVKLPSLRRAEKPIIYLKKDETQMLFDALRSDFALTARQSNYHTKQQLRDTAIIYLLLSSGIRVSELVGLDFDDIDFGECCVHVIRKGGKYDTAYFSDECADVLREYVEYRRSQKTLPGHEQAVFLSSQKRRVTTRTVEVLVNKYKERAGIEKHITPHKLRATAATDVYEAVGDVLAIKEKLGHANVETSMVYIGGAEERKRAQRNAVQYKTRSN